MKTCRLPKPASLAYEPSTILRQFGLSGQELSNSEDFCRMAWADWLKSAEIKVVDDCCRGAFIAILLPGKLGSEIETAWSVRPSQAYLMHALAGELCQSLLRWYLPEIGVQGCAPFPRLSDHQASWLRGQGILSETSGQACLARPYSALTWYPYRGGCEVCSLQGCVKRAARIRD